MKLKLKIELKKTKLIESQIKQSGGDVLEDGKDNRLDEDEDKSDIARYNICLHDDDKPGQLMWELIGSQINQSGGDVLEDKDKSFIMIQINHL